MPSLIGALATSPDASFLRDPNVAISSRIAVGLQEERAALGREYPPAAGWLFRQLHLLVDHHAIVLHRGYGRLGDLALGIELRHLVIDIISLPGERRES